MGTLRATALPDARMGKRKKEALEEAPISTAAEEETIGFEQVYSKSGALQPFISRNNESENTAWFGLNWASF